MRGRFTIEEPFTCEVRVKKCAYTSGAGATLLLELPGLPAIDALTGTEGKRYQFALITIEETADGERLAHADTGGVGPRCLEAIGMCNNADFRAWARTRGPWQDTPDAAKAFILSTLNINSRKELDTDDVALAGWISMLRAYRRWLAEREGVRV